MNARTDEISRDRADYVLARLIPTRWNDNDAFGHMNNAVHYQFFDTAVNLQLRDWGSVQGPQDDFRFVVAETGCRYFAEMRYPSEILTCLRIARLGRSSVCYELGLFPDGALKAAATGYLVHVHVATHGSRPTPIPDDLRDRMFDQMGDGTHRSIQMTASGWELPREDQ